MPVDSLPEPALLPDQVPEAVQAVASVLDQASIELAPEVTEPGLAEIVTVGTATLCSPDEPPAQAVSRIANAASAGLAAHVTIVRIRIAPRIVLKSIELIIAGD